MNFLRVQSDQFWIFHILLLFCANSTTFWYFSSDILVVKIFAFNRRRSLWSQQENSLTGLQLLQQKSSRREAFNEFIFTDSITVNLISVTDKEKKYILHYIPSSVVAFSELYFLITSQERTNRQRKAIFFSEIIVERKFLSALRHLSTSSFQIQQKSSRDSTLQLSTRSFVLCGKATQKHNQAHFQVNKFSTSIFAWNNFLCTHFD